MSDIYFSDNPNNNRNNGNSRPPLQGGRYPGNVGRQSGQPYYSQNRSNGYYVNHPQNSGYNQYGSNNQYLNDMAERNRQAYYGQNTNSIYNQSPEYNQPYQQPQQETPQVNYVNQNDFYEYPEQIPEAPKKPKKKKKHKALKAFAAIIIVIAILFAGLNVAAFAFISSIDYTKGELKGNEYIDSSELNSSNKVTNILLIGVDGKETESNRSDSMILMSIDYAHSKIKLTSFLRDSWVQIPSKGYAKLNAACSWGGPQLVVDTLEYNFRVDIDHYVLVNFEMFTEIIDSLGGIDIEVTEKEANFINETTRYTVDSGENVHLDGSEALVYARIRKLDTDYMRTFRQRKVINSLLTKLKKSSPGEIVNMIKDVLPLLETDLNEADIMGLMYKAGFAALTFDIQQLQLPSDDLFTQGYQNGQWVENVDIEGCRSLLYDFIFTDYETEKED